jgi:hypothetical protein
LISFLSSSSSPGGALIKPTPHIAYPDIKVGIPSLLLAVEMSIFATIHIWAFSWKPYDIKKNPIPGAAYHGGKFGLKALWDAFNLWDVVKAAARAFRWLFHGRKFREGDISYEASRGASGPSAKPFGHEEDTSYQGLQSLQPYEHDQEMGVLPQGVGGGRRPLPPHALQRMTSDASDDQKGLLSHAQSNPHSSDAVPPDMADGDLGQPGHHIEYLRR